MKKILLFLMFMIFTTVNVSFAQVSDYVFQQSAGSYTPISGGTVVASGTGSTGVPSMDDVIWNLPDATIPFPFTFDGSNYTGLNISSNGFITFGATAPSSSSYIPISATTLYNGAISAFGRDLQGGWVTSGDRTLDSPVLTNVANLGPAQVGDFISGTGIPTGATIVSIAGNTITMSANATTTGTLGSIQFVGSWSEIRYQTIGSAPNRVFVIQFSNFKRFGTALATVQHMSLNFQFRLYETSNKVEVVYNNCSPGLTTFTTVNQVGLRGPNNTFPTNVNNRLNVKGTNDNWLNSSPGTGNASGMLFNNVAPANVIGNGLTYSWTAPVVGAPVISYSLLPNTFQTGNIQLNNVIITTGDPNGIAGGANAPRVYWRVNGGAWQSSATTSGSSPYNFTIGTTGLTIGDNVQYFVIAQTAVTNIVNSNPAGGLVATSVNNITTYPTSPNAYSIVANWNFGSNGQAGNNLYYFANSTAGAGGSPSQPPFVWRDTTGSINLFANGVQNPDYPIASGGVDDAVVPILASLGGGTIRLFGTDYTDFYLGYNGIISFTSFVSSSANWQPPSGGIPQANVLNAIFPFWTDLNPASTVVPADDKRISLKVTATELIITFTKIPVYAASSFSTDPNRFVTFQVIIEFSNLAPTQNSRIFVSFDDAQSGSLFISENNANTLRTNLIGAQGDNAANQVVVYRYQSTASLVTPGPIFSSPLTVAFGPNDNALPVDLIAFNASVDANDVMLTWTTAWEENNARFDVQRRPANTEAQWTTVGNVAGNGTTYEPRNYSYEDKNLASGSYEYRLVQFDYDGNSNADFNLSQTVEVGIPSTFALAQNYPNPFNPTTKIDFQIPVEGLVKLSVFDMSGREVATLVNEALTPGYYTYDFNGSNLSSGAYFYRLVTKNSVITKKLMLVK